jgi:pimeloyl-ACP methyl ester carboxylesterase
MWKRLLLVLAIVLIAAMVAFVIWGSTPARPMAEAQAALTPDAQVGIETEPWLVFAPASEPKDTGLILYPGGRVDPRAYAPTATAIARAGYPVVIVPMPLNLAVLGAGRADEVIAAFPEITRWAIGGHSLGGAMAATYAHDNPAAVQGLVLWAAYPAGGANLSGRTDLAVTSIWGTLDGVATPEDIEGSKALLPPQTVYVPIEGGNHAQFGWYGPQNGDNPATISHLDQQAQVVSATLQLLEQVGAGGPG